MSSLKKSTERNDDMRKSGMVFCAVCTTVGAALADFTPDCSVMSDAYWKIWTPEALAKMDADIEKYRKADASVEIDAPDGTEVKVEQV